MTHEIRCRRTPPCSFLPATFVRNLSPTQTSRPLSFPRPPGSVRLGRGGLRRGRPFRVCLHRRRPHSSTTPRLSRPGHHPRLHEAVARHPPAPNSDLCKSNLNARSRGRPPEALRRVERRPCAPGPATVHPRRSATFGPLMRQRLLISPPPPPPPRPRTAPPPSAGPAHGLRESAAGGPSTNPTA